MIRERSRHLTNFLARFVPVQTAPCCMPPYPQLLFAPDTGIMWLTSLLLFSPVYAEVLYERAYTKPTPFVRRQEARSSSSAADPTQTPGATLSGGVLGWYWNSDLCELIPSGHSPALDFAYTNDYRGSHGSYH